LKDRGYLFAWRYAAKIPEPMLRGLTNLAADIVWLKHGKGITRLESNYAKVRPELSPAQVRRLSRQGMRSYLRYFREAFCLPAASPAQLGARVRAVNDDLARAAIADHGGVVVALGHAGNWDLAGAWAGLYLAQVLTVAEKLQPEQLYQEFLAFRQGLGMSVLGLGDPGIFDQLVAGAGQGKLVPLLADRDLTSRGITVELCGQPARVAAGPATVALTAQAPLLVATIHYERLRGTRRRAAGTPWGIVITFSPIWEPTPSTAMPDKTQVATLTQAWVTRFGEFLQQHTADWHMLQKVFVADLDPERYAATLAAAAATIGGR